MPKEDVAALDNALERALGDRCPWVPESRLRHAAQLLARRMSDAGVDNSETFTMDMLVDAQATGHDLAKIMGSAPMTPGTPLAPAAAVVIGGGGRVLYGGAGLPYPPRAMPYPAGAMPPVETGAAPPWDTDVAGEGGQYFHGA
jgi:hypothetical protein